MSEPKKGHVHPITTYLMPQIEMHLAKTGNTGNNSTYNVLLLAAGEGSELVTILDRYAENVRAGQIRICATDKDPRCIEKLSMVTEHFDVKSLVDVKAVDAHQIDYPDGFFNAITCFHGPMMFDDTKKAFSEITRVLKKQSNALAVMTTPSDQLLGDALDEANKRVSKEQRAPDWHLVKTRMGDWISESWADTRLPNDLKPIARETISHERQMSTDGIQAFLSANIWPNEMMAFVFNGLHNEEEKDMFKHVAADILTQKLKEQEAYDKKNATSVAWSRSILVVAERE